MTWFKIDDAFYDHPKTLALESGGVRDQAIALWVLAGTWAARHLTDGRVPTAIVDRFSLSDMAASELVRVGLWDQGDDCYTFHDWKKYQPTKSKNEKRKAEQRRRTRKSRAAKKSVDSPHSTDQGNAPCNALHEPLLTRDPGTGTGNKLREVFVRGFAALWEAHTGDLWQLRGRYDDAINRIVQACSAKADPERAVRAVLAGIESDRYVNEEGLPLPLIASKVDELMAKGVRRVAKPESAEDALRAKLATLKAAQDEARQTGRLDDVASIRDHMERVRAEIRRAREPARRTG